MGKRKERRIAAMSSANRRVKLDLFAEPSEKLNSLNSEFPTLVRNSAFLALPFSFLLRVLPFSSLRGFRRHHTSSISPPLRPPCKSPSSPSLLRLHEESLDFHRPPPPYLSTPGQKQDNPLLLLGQYSDDELDDEASKQEDDGIDCSMEPDDKGEEHVDANENLENNKNEISESNSSKLESDQANTPKELKANDTETIENTSVGTENCETVLTGRTCGPELMENQCNGHVIGDWKLVLHDESNQYYYWNTVTGETSWVVPEALNVDTQTTDEHCVSTTAIEERVANAGEAQTFTGMTVYGHVLSADGNESSNPVPKDTDEEKVYESSQIVGHYSTDNVAATYGQFSGYSSLSEHLTNLSGPQNALNSEEMDVHLSRGSDHYASEDAHASQLVKYGEVLLQRLDMLYGSAQQPEEHKEIRREIDIRISDCRALSSYGSSLLPFWWHTDTQLKQIESAIIKSEASSLVQPEDFSNLTAMQKDPQGAAYSKVTEKDDQIIVTCESGNDTLKNENASTEKMSTNINFEGHGTGQKSEICQEDNLIPDSTSLVPTFYEEDMDVEMEVDDESPPIPSSEQFIQTNLQLPPYPSIPSAESHVPPPPEEEWIPPPPPEIEPLPPLPPFESDVNPPLEASFPQSYTETISYSFPDHHNVGYHVPTYDYYSSTGTDVSNVAYYGFPGVAPQLVHSSVLELPVDSLGNSLPKINAQPPSAPNNPSKVKREKNTFVNTTFVAVHVIPFVACGQCLTTVILDGALGKPCMTATLRSKKRMVTLAPTLMSNKKVSSLVDKWKAAKEELHGDEEDEPENALEILEKKRQKEIEQWRARQVATGEAQDNANFVPLGVDWRERVKRRRTADTSTENAQTSSTSTANGQKQPDLVELSKGLPSGWQVYWDDSTKQAYYGNQHTSETSWSRPTR
ncbi:hypothetical protein KSP40_PGU013693 [Platanthera guangdongensis]|uniref:WW domain-containing protein n=1 Tax=Platanthera guangdongensis TaxID=2320717 RepID=A0ABR2N0U9_9ASPA